jgi:hypothetical protein
MMIRSAAAEDRLARPRSALRKHGIRSRRPPVPSNIAPAPVDARTFDPAAVSPALTGLAPP